MNTILKTESSFKIKAYKYWTRIFVHAMLFKLKNQRASHEILQKYGSFMRFFSYYIFE